MEGGSPELLLAYSCCGTGDSGDGAPGLCQQMDLTLPDSSGANLNSILLTSMITLYIMSLIFTILRDTLKLIIILLFFCKNPGTRLYRVDLERARSRQSPSDANLRPYMEMTGFS